MKNRAQCREILSRQMTGEILNEAPRFGNSIISSKSKTTRYYSFRIVQYWTAICSGLAEDASATFATAIGRYSWRKAVEQNRSKHVTDKPKQRNPFCDWRFNMQPARNRVLCVDDHEDSRGMMKVLLEMWNYEVALAGAAEDGIYLARSEPFDLYLLDAHLSDGSAFELCEQICGVPGHAPVVLISTAPYEADKQRGREAGAIAYLAKPLDFDVLEIKLARLITQAQGSDLENNGARPI
jgi:CheY-like chemotaxis protein